MNEDVFPIENGDFTMPFVSFRGCKPPFGRFVFTFYKHNGYQQIQVVEDTCLIFVLFSEVDPSHFWEFLEVSFVFQKRLGWYIYMGIFGGSPDSVSKP